MKQLATGVYHTFDFVTKEKFRKGTQRWKNAGKRICGPYILFVAMLCADLDYAANKWGLRHWNSNTPCSLCDGDYTNDLNMFDFGAGARWARTLKSLRHCLENPISHPLYSGLSLTVFNYCPDIMHCCFLGVWLHIIANVLIWLEGKVEGNNQGTRVRNVYAMLKRAYDELDVPSSERVPELKRSTYREGADYPEMSCKAAHAKHLLPALELVIERVELNDRLDRHVVRCVKNANMFAHIIEQHEFALPPEEASRAIRCAHNAVGSYGVLAKASFFKKERLWCLVFKFHWWLHLAHACRRYNPRIGWVFMDEDWVGRIARIAHSSSFGRGDFKLSPILVEKYLLGMDVDLYIDNLWR